MTIGTSFLTNKIYVGNTRKLKSGAEVWTKKEDITEEAIKAVFEHMYIQAKKTGVYEISIEGYGKMTLVRDKKEETDK